MTEDFFPGSDGQLVKSLTVHFGFRRFPSAVMAMNLYAVDMLRGMGWKVDVERGSIRKPGAPSGFRFTTVGNVKIDMVAPSAANPCHETAIESVPEPIRPVEKKVAPSMDEMAKNMKVIEQLMANHLEKKMSEAAKRDAEAKAKADWIARKLACDAVFAKRMDEMGVDEDGEPSA